MTGELKKAKTQVDRIKQRMGGGYAGDDLVIINERTEGIGYYTLNQSFGRVQQRARAAGIKLRVMPLKGLRSTHATVLSQHGWTGREMADRLGHADGGVTATRHYLSSSVNRQRELIRRMEEGSNG